AARVEVQPGDLVFVARPEHGQAETKGKTGLKVHAALLSRHVRHHEPALPDRGQGLVNHPAVELLVIKTNRLVPRPLHRRENTLRVDRPQIGVKSHGYEDSNGLRPGRGKSFDLGPALWSEIACRSFIVRRYGNELERFQILCEIADLV